MTINWAITHSEWSLDSIYETDDVDRLRQTFANMKQLVGDALCREVALQALYSACERNAPACSDWLARIAASRQYPPLNPPALHLAAEERRAAAVKFLARHCRKQEISSLAPRALLWASSRNDLELVQIFAMRSAASQTDARGQTALMLATDNFGTEVLRALLPYADRKQRDQNGHNALMHAISNLNIAAVAMLLVDASREEIDSKMAGRQSARELAKQVQNENHWHGLGDHARQFRPLDMIEARVEPWEIADEIDVARASIGLAAPSKARRVRRL